LAEVAREDDDEPARSLASMSTMLSAIAQRTPKARVSLSFAKNALSLELWS